MTDKSFGDYTNKNPLKNPLLSTAVTGLSISDLTQNAVLLPVAQNQELITVQDLQNETQDRTVTHTGHSALNFPSGDVSPNILASHLSNSNPSSILSDKQSIANERIHDLHGSTLSKASVKSDDDFDFNEYFARLQGTRYVSAPVNSLLKEDQNANLEAAEENLEEINLNEPSKPQHDYDTQQSITADIAQNFSQLPTVLPQVASAVFSSFSSMLNLKSREQTPDDVKTSPRYQELPPQKSEEATVPLIGLGAAEEVKEVAPPPKEPPSIGVGSYRITTKKKAYAQIPGLSCRDNVRDTPYSPPSSVNPISVPTSYFVPSSSEIQTLSTEIYDTQHAEQKFSTDGLKKNIDSNLHENTPDSSNLFNSFKSNPSDSVLVTKNPEYIISSQTQPKGEQIVLSDLKIQSQINVQVQDVSTVSMNSSIPQGSIIPPPPMFSNLPKRDNLATNTERSILPPSVARRISANHPIIKSLPQQNTSLPFHNIFNPATIADNENSTFENPSLYQPPLTDMRSAAGELYSPVFSCSTLPATQPHFATKPQFSGNLQEAEKSEVVSPFVITSQEQASLLATNQFTCTSANTTQTNTASYFHINPGIVTDAVKKSQSDPINSDISVHNTGALDSENVKHISQPPKLSSGNMNFRMTKKRPQYYSGPIAGIGEISNNIKPEITAVSTSSFTGTLFTPQNPLECSVSDNSIAGPINAFSGNNFQSQETVSSFGFINNVSAQQIDKAPEPFNRSKPAEDAFLNVQFDASTFQKDVTCQSVYNTAFDVSRDPSESYEDHRPEPQTFGIIGSLKSKLSSIDINKIQNSVTNFFDPAYNDVQKDVQTQENLTFENHYQNIEFPTPVSSNTDSFEIFVPQVEHQVQFNNYPTGNQNFNYGEKNQNPIFFNYQNQENFSFQQSQNHTYIYPTSESQQISTPLLPYDERVLGSAESEQDTTNVHHKSLCTDEKQTSKYIFDVHNDISHLSDVTTKESAIISDQNTTNILGKLCHDEINTTQQQNSGDAQEPRALENMRKHYEKLSVNDGFYSSRHEVTNLLHKTDHAGKTELTKSSISISAQTNLETLQDTKDCKLTSDSNKEQCLEKYVSIKTEVTAKDTKDTDDITELNICETCREMNKSENKEPDGLTAQLIENITAPIQLSNAVEVPLTESNTPLEDRSDFDPDQYAEISHITEETIETLIVQSATELLDDVDKFTDPNVNSYGWSTDIKNTLNPKDIFDHNYSFQLNTGSGGLIGNSSLFFDNMPNNASDEIKAELKNHEDPLVILPRQMSIPTAPPEEFDENRSEEAGVLDVQSIEQDAKTDFPIFEEFVIEPSETDDDKIEFRERKRSSEDSTSEKDTFTNRVERFKKMEGTYVDSKNHDTLDHHNKIQLFDFPTTNSPVIPIASYFDTGNYAAESHYRNSLTSTITLTSFTAPSETIRIPPGFEEEFQRKLSYDSSQNVGANLLNMGDKAHSPYIPETTTQTKLVDLVTFGMAQTVNSQKIIPRLENAHKEIIRPIDLDEKNIQRTDESEQEKLLNNNLHAFNVQFDNLQHISCEVSNNEEKVNIPASQIQTHTFGDENIKLEQASKLEITLENILPTEQGQDEGDIRPEQALKQENTSVIILPPKHAQDVEDIKLEQALEQINTADIILLPKQTQDIKEPQLCSMFVSDEAELTREENTSGSFILENSNPNSSNDRLPLIQGAQSLPDPINFFSSNVAESDNSFNRLASYFTTPPKTDPSKAFFELSQSQDHYRHSKHSEDFWNNSNKEFRSDYYELNQHGNQTSNKDMNTISPDRYLANLDLIKDLTSYDNYEPKEQIVTTVNYFTVEYDNNVLNKFSITNTGKVQKDEVKSDLLKDNAVITDSSNFNTHLELEGTSKMTNEMQVNLIQYCVYCCNIDMGRLKNVDNVESFVSLEKIKVRKSMDGQNSESVREKDSAVDQDKSSGNNKSYNVSFNHLKLEEEGNDNTATTTENRPAANYTPVKYHWFYRVDFEEKSTWRGFSTVDSAALEEAFHSPELNENTVVPTDGGRFDVNVLARLRVAVYWADKPTNVMRCSWFYKGTTDVRYVPYSEEMAERLEVEYRHGVTTGEWHRRLVLDNSELVVMHGPTVMVHFLQGATQDAFSAPNQAMIRPRVVRRGFDETEIEESEPSNIDHLLLMCHGVGSACDMRFRSVEEVVDDFRATSLQLLQSHYRNSFECGRVNRVEVLPISWHSTLHSGETGVDSRLARVTLQSIPRLRNFTNDTVLDVLFYTSPIYSQTIVDTVCSELNRIYALFKKRNPNFKGGVSLGGHSLGSVILYDLLCHQEPDPNARRDSTSEKEYVSSSAQLGQPNVKYPKLSFYPDAMYGLGSPIAIFECIRGVEHLGKTFALPTCKNFFNIFHPYDPIAYRIEPLINPELRYVKPYLIPHHKGRKRMHLELKDTMFRVGADLKQRLFESLKTTWSTMWRTEVAPPSGKLEKVVDEELEKQNLTENSKEETQQKAEMTVTPDMLGKLNAGRRIDYVLQEAPFEMINEYLFAMSSHVCYWESEDTMLMMLREIYDGLGIQPDSTVPQQSLTVERNRTAEDEPVDAPTTSRTGYFL